MYLFNCSYTLTVLSKGKPLNYQFNYIAKSKPIKIDFHLLDYLLDIYRFFIYISSSVEAGVRGAGKEYFYDHLLDCLPAPFYGSSSLTQVMPKECWIVAVSKPEMPLSVT